MPADAGSVPTDRPALGIAQMLGAGFLITANDGFVKLLLEELPIGEVVALRGTVLLIIVLLLARLVGGPRALKVANWKAQWLRAVLAAASIFLFVASLAVLPLSTAVTLAFVNPLFVTALAPFVLGEKVGWRRRIAVLAGFAGVIVIVQPTGDGAGWAYLIPIAAALTGAIRDLMTRRLSASESSMSMMVLAFLAVLPIAYLSWPLGEAGLLSGWRLPDATALIWLLCSSIFLGGALYLMIESFRNAEAAAVSPFKYVSLLWATILELMIWERLPGLEIYLGAAIIIGAALYIFQRERRRPLPVPPER